MSDDWPLVTVGVCTKNCETMVADIMTSILELDYPYNRLEVIIVDGGSKDRTLDMINEKLKNAVFPWRVLLDEGRGIAYARQIVIDKSKGMFIAFVDADQCVRPDWLKKLVEMLLRNDEVAAVESATLSFPSRSVVAKLEWYTMDLANKRRFKRGEAKSVTSGGVLFRKKAINSVGGYDLNFRISGEDIDLSMRLLKAGWKLLFCPEAQHYHSWRESWIELWGKYRNWGKGAAQLAEKYQEFASMRFLPPIAFLSGIKHAINIYKGTKDLRAVLVPFHYAYKRTAYCLGYVDQKREMAEEKIQNLDSINESEWDQNYEGV